MSLPPDQDTQLEGMPSNDHRPNSGLREGDISHADVNEALLLAPKTVIFGQQTRLRLGLLMEDETLPRFHAGHDMVKFFYGAIRQIPDVILDAIFAAGISVVLVMERDMIAYRHVRCHQAFHTGRTRRTIYIPEQVIAAAFNKGYDYWALSEVIIKEAWPLLDYILILELVRHVQVKLHQVHLPGISFIKDKLRELNKHLKDPSQRLRDEGRATLNPKEDEFMLFYGTYAPHFLAWDRGILDRDPYDIADEVFDEGVERQWASWKVNDITETFNYPTYFQVDRDIVHPAAYELATKYGQPLEPTTVDEVIHDLHDVARFRVGRQVKTEPLLDQLIDCGAPGIRAFAQACALEKATQQLVITNYYFDGYHTVSRFRQKLQDWSSDWPVDLGLGLLFDALAKELVVVQTRELLASSSIDFGTNVRDQIAQLARMIPDNAYRLSSDPQATRRRLDDFRRVQGDDPDSAEQWSQLAGIFLRLDKVDNYAELVAVVGGFGVAIHPALEQIVESIGPRDERRAVIRRMARHLLNHGGSDTGS